MLRKTPKTFDTVDMILGLSANQSFFVVDGKMLPQPFQRVVAPERVGVVYRTLPGLLPDDSHKFFFGHVLHDSRIHLAVALQKAKYNVLTRCASAAFAFASAAKVALVHLYLTVQSAALKLGYVVDRFAQALVHAGNGLVVEPKVVREAVRRLLLVESLDDSDFRSDPLQGLLFSTVTVATPHIPTRGFVHLERSTEHTLFTPQKVGRATENILSSCNHKDILAPCGYETH